MWQPWSSRALRNWTDGLSVGWSRRRAGVYCGVTLFLPGEEGGTHGQAAQVVVLSHVLPFANRYVFEGIQQIVTLLEGLPALAKQITLAGLCTGPRAFYVALRSRNRT